MSHLTSEELSKISDVRDKYGVGYAVGFESVISGEHKVLDIENFRSYSKKQWIFVKTFAFFALRMGKNFTLQFLEIEDYIDLYSFGNREGFHVFFNDLLQFKSDSSNEDIENLKNLLNLMFEDNWSNEYLGGVLCYIGTLREEDKKKAA